MTMLAFAFALLLQESAPARPGPTSNAQPTLARGVVFDDRDGDGARGPGEPGLAGVRVSNGRAVVETDAEGAWSLPVSDDAVLFVIKPRNWSPPLDENHMPRFHYVHKPAGSPPGLAYPGVAPTGPLPASIDFPLQRRPEPNRFRVVLFGDPQPRDERELEYLARDVVEELVGVDATFGVSLGDIVFDDLDLFEPQNAVVGGVGIPWHHVHGNHDMNYDVPSDELADETWERVYGPTTYSFDCGPVHFVVLDDVLYEGDPESRAYHSEIGRHLEFLAEDLRFVPEDRLVVLFMHIPLTETRDRRALFELLGRFQYTLSFSAHHHTQRHVFFGEEDGWPRPQRHHHLIHATACGSWWAGAPDERGIPHATMACGTPNGYSVVTFDDRVYTIRFKAARRPPDHQMNIWAPASVPQSRLAETEVLVNVFAGSEQSAVEMRCGEASEWIRLTQEPRPDPYFLDLKRLEQVAAPLGRELPEPIDSPHLWVGRLPEGLAPGTHALEVRTRDMFGRQDSSARLIRVEADG